MQYGPAVTVRLVDVFSQEMERFPEINKMIQDGRLRLPITSINGQPRYQGGISLPLLNRSVAEILAAES